MRFVEVSDLFQGEGAELAVLSTFQFDPDFFEQRLLRSPSLSNSRRILVFMDAGQWRKLASTEVAARGINRRYLVAPVRRPWGAFHPKLHLFISEGGGQLQCGSNNLTRAGCSSNLELLNAFRIDLSGDEIPRALGQEALAFFEVACAEVEGATGQLAKAWLTEAIGAAPWLKVASATSERPIELVHSYQGSLWDRLVKVLEKERPRKFLIISPFHDVDNGLLRRLKEKWPKCPVEIVVQQRTTNLQAAKLRKGSDISLSEVVSSSRRLHAKLLAWETKAGSGCLVGSANFTSAAFDGRNVEVSLLVRNAVQELAALFDVGFKRRMIAFDDFEPGSEQEPEAYGEVGMDLRLDSAMLGEDGGLRVAYRCRMTQRPLLLGIELRTPGERRPRFTAPLAVDRLTASVQLPEQILKDVSGALLASLSARWEDQATDSAPVWVVQESRLTHEPSGHRTPSSRSKVEETGEGLREILEELDRQGGALAVIEFLRQHSIRFFDGETRFGIRRKFRLRERDPFRPDTAPDWLVHAKIAASVEAAILDWVTRHERRCLRKHASRGNVNGMENFVDVLAAMVELLWSYHLRGVVSASKVVGRLCTYVQIATLGIDNDTDDCDGFLSMVAENLRDPDELQAAIDEVNFLGHVYAVLALAQQARHELQNRQLADYKAGKNPLPFQLLPLYVDTVSRALQDAGVKAPSTASVLTALQEYRVFSKGELEGFERQVAGVLGEGLGRERA